MRSRFGLRFGETRIPMVEITVSGVDKPVVVKRRYGFTKQHALTRAIAWKHAHDG
jgi:hypothetical protein